MFGFSFAICCIFLEMKVGRRLTRDLAIEVTFTTHTSGNRRPPKGNVDEPRMFSQIKAPLPLSHHGTVRGRNVSFFFHFFLVPCFCLLFTFIYITVYYEFSERFSTSILVSLFCFCSCLDIILFSVYSFFYSIFVFSLPLSILHFTVLCYYGFCALLYY